MPGTYVLSILGRRDWGGEALQRSAIVNIQVGTSTVGSHSPRVHGCDACHVFRPSFGITELQDRLAGFGDHGIADRSTCYGCHAETELQPDNALDVAVHTVHSRSERLTVFSNTPCVLCHLPKPDGTPRGDPE